MVWVFGLLFVFLFMIPITGLMLNEAPWIFERNTKERRLLLAMYRELCRYPDDWERRGPGILHHPSGLQVRKAGGLWPSYSFVSEGGTVEFTERTRGGRIATRLFLAVEALEKRQRDLQAIKGMTAVFQRDQVADIRQCRG